MCAAFSAPFPGTGAPIRVVVADVHPAARAAVAGVLEGLVGVELVGSVAAWRDIAPDLRPDVLVIDDRLVDGIEDLLADIGPLRMIVVGVDDNPAYAARAHRLGAEAWVAKDRADDELQALLGRPASG
jgi:DNA-binding NarL/FixJ family response regulator